MRKKKGSVSQRSR